MPRALYHTNSTVCLCILEIYVWKVTLLSSYLLLDYFYYLPVKRRPTKIQIYGDTNCGDTKLIFVIRLFLLHSCKKKANESTNFGGKRLGNLLWRH